MTELDDATEPGSPEAELGTAHRRATVLFADITGFAALVDPWGLTLMRTRTFAPHRSLEVASEDETTSRVR